jgi:eukaryotic-like serine/threonine-protein kinase
MKMLMEHLQSSPIPPSQRTELPIPRELDDLIMACLQKDPDRRPQNASELFQIVCNCHDQQEWTQGQAEDWWKAHLPELTGPLAVSTARPLTTGTVSV